MEKDIISNPVMWTPSDERINSSQMFKFIKVINDKYNLDIINKLGYYYDVNDKRKLDATSNDIYDE